MRQSIAIISFFASAALAKDTTIQFFFPGGYDGAEPVATITQANPSTTAMRLACPTGVDSSDCGWGPGVDYSIISSTIYELSMSVDSYTMSLRCDYNTRKQEMSCGVDEQQATTMEDMDGIPTTTVLTGSDIVFLTATVEKGAELLSGSAQATETSNAKSTGFDTSAKATGTAAAASGATASGASATGKGATASGASATASGSLPEHTGAAARFGIEGSALLALAGAAALNIW